MKKLHILCAVIMIAVLLCGCSSPAAQIDLSYKDSEKINFTEWKVESFATAINTYSSAEERLSVMSEVANDGKNTLYLDPANGDIALKSGDSLYFSTPWNLATDVKSVDSHKKKIASAIRLSFMDAKQSVSEIFSFDECIAKGQYTLKKFKNGVQVNMIIGRAEQRTLLPTALPKASFEKVVETLAKRGQARMKALYKLYDPEETPENQLELIREKYPVVDKEPIYVLKSVTDKEKAELEGYFSDAGYTFDDLDKDLEAVGAVEEETVSPRFVISVRYELKDGELVVSVPTSLIEYDTEHFTLLEIGVLEYFAASDCSGDGYVLVPDGSGAVIGFNKNGNKLGNDIKIPVYGYDRALNYNAGYENLMAATLPVFGIASQNGTMLAIIDEGESLADIIASSGGSTSGYSRAGVSFSYCDYDSFEYKDVNTQYFWNLADKNAYKGTYKIRYVLLQQGSGYSEMAQYYKQSLKLDSKVKDKGLNLVLGLYGSVLHSDEFLFIPYESQQPLTTFDDAYVIADEMLKAGIKDLDLRYIGWNSGGLNANPDNSVSVQSVLGGEDGLTQLYKKLNKKNIGLFMNADLAYVGNSGWFDGFSAVDDTCRMLDKTYAGYNEVRLSSGLMNEDVFKYALRPQSMLNFYNDFEAEYGELSLSGLSLSTLGNSLNSDKDNDEGANRDVAQRYAKEILKHASGKYELLVDGGNRYCYDYVSGVIDLPNCASGYPDADYSVPFVQMVLHGKVNYTGASVNLSGNYRTEVLKAIEGGSGLYFELAYRNSDILKLTDYAKLYSVDYKTWKQKIIDCYTQVNEAVGDLNSEDIVKHTYIADGVSSVEYSSGVTIYVNYNETDFEANGVLVPASGFVRTQKEG